jgi:hypothetical protein
MARGGKLHPIKSLAMPPLIVTGSALKFNRPYLRRHVECCIISASQPYCHNNVDPNSLPRLSTLQCEAITRIPRGRLHCIPALSACLVASDDLDEMRQL